MTSRDVWVAVIVFAGWMVSLCLHEFGHAIVAYWGGDTSVKDKGYLTLNPLNYTHPLLSIGLPFIFLLIGGIPLPGGAVYIDEKRLRNRLWRSLVSAAGPFASLLTAFVLAMPFRFQWGASSNPIVDLGETAFNLLNPNTLTGQVNPANFMDGVLFPALALLIALDVYVTLFNLLPIPPLDGYGIIEPWLPSSLQHKVRNSGIPWIFVLFGVLWFVPPLLWGLFLVTGLLTSLLGVPPFWTTMGFMLFNARPIALLFGIFVALFLVRALVRHLRRPIDVWINSLDLIGWLLLHLRQYSAALKCYRQAVRSNPEAHGGIWTNLGTTLSRLNRHEEAIAAFEQGLAVDPDYSDPTFKQGSHQLWLGRGLSLMELHRDEEALRSFQHALDVDPDFIHAASMKIAVLQRLKRAEEALKECDRLLSDSKLPKSLYSQMQLFRGEILLDLKREEEALEIFEQYSQKQSQSPAGWHDRGVVLIKLNRPDEALDAFETALQRSPKFRLSWLQKGWLLFNLKRYDEALDCCQRSQRWLGQDAGMLNIKGATLTRLGRTDEAIAAYDRAVHMQPQNADNWYNRACYYAEVGDVAGAIANLRHAISLYPQAAVNAQSDESFDRIRHHSEFQSLYNGADRDETTHSSSDRSD